MTAAGSQLMARAQAGDVDAFGELYSRYRPSVLAYARSRHPGLAEDIAQDVFVRALGSLHRWVDQGKSPAAWLQTITANVCHDRFTRSPERRLNLVYEMPDVPDRPDRTDPAALAMQDLARREVLVALLELTDPQREAVVLFYLREMSLIEVAEVMGRAEGAVKALLHRARREMARHLAGAR